LTVVEAVVRSRVPERPAQEKILASARERIASWLERGGRFEPLQTRERPVIEETERRRERVR